MRQRKVQRWIRSHNSLHKSILAPVLRQAFGSAPKSGLSGPETVVLQINAEQGNTFWAQMFQRSKGEFALKKKNQTYKLYYTNTNIISNA